MKNILTMLILFTGVCLHSSQILNYNHDDSILNLRFNGLLAYHQGETNKAHRLLSSYLEKSKPNQDDWKTYVIFHFINRDLERCDFSPINSSHKKIIEKTDWNNKIEEINIQCNSR